ncbi:integrase, catalytic region, zinc finger, CCHC-type containing protein [Tanacetum coccineum]|uniref:Integrase, catalytic region, zinc finger, CCHC-type containing protein n=1 Tax=Tanacetum coccineum TaxID=301880 RepID=A0ABQ5EWH9_9ASTR
MSTQQDIDASGAQRLANTHDPLTFMENTQTPFHPDQSSLITHIQHPLPNNYFVPQPSFNTNYMQQPMQNLGIQIIGNMNGLSVVSETVDQYGNVNVVTTLAEGNGNGINVNSIKCYNCRGEGHYASNCTVKPRKRDAAYLQQQLSISQEEEAGIQSTQEESNFMVVSGACEEIERSNANCTVENNLQQASTSGTQTDKAPVYDSDGSAEIQLHDNCYNDEIFNMFTQEEQYTELLEPIPKPHQVPHNDSNVIYEVSSMEQGGGIVEQHPANFEETRVLYDSLYNNLATEVEKVNSVNRKLRETNANLTTELARYKNQETCKQITALNEEILNLNKQLSNEKSVVSSLQVEKKRLKSDFKIREDGLLDKQIQLENKVKELDNILVKTGQSIQTMHILSPKPDSFYHTEKKMALGYQNPFYLKQAQQKQQSLYNGKILLEKHDPPTVYDSEETLELAQSLKMKQLNKEIKPANYTKINHLSGVFVSQTAKSREELYLSNASKTANVSNSILIPNEEFSDDTTPSVAQKFLNEVKSTIVTLQRVVKQKMTLDIHNWSSSAHQEIHKIVKNEIFLIVNQVDTRVQNFEIQFLKEAAKFVQDFKSLANEANESLAKHKELELEIERLLRAVVSQDIMSIMQNTSVVYTSNLQTELERTKERFENCIIKKENEYAKLWNDWYKKCEECKYDKISYDKAYNDIQQKIEWFQAQLGDQKGINKDTPCVLNSLDPFSQKLENENVELEFQIKNYAKENAHLKTTYKNLFDSINVTRTHTKAIIDSLQNKLHDTIYENAKLRAQLFNKVSKQKYTTRGTSANTKFTKKSILGKTV